jgi:hypothetical protein
MRPGSANKSLYSGKAQSKTAPDKLPTIGMNRKNHSALLIVAHGKSRIRFGEVLGNHRSQYQKARE